MKKHIVAWSREPVIVPRWMLTMKYLGFVVLGILSSLGGIPTIAHATFDSFTTYMSIGLVVVSVVGVASSFRRDWEWVEKWAALSIAAFLATWSVAAIWAGFADLDLGRAAGAFAVLLLAMLPASRSFGLMTRAGL